MTSCTCSKKTPEKVETQMSSEDLKRETPEKIQSEVSSEDVKRETGEALETTKNLLSTAKESYQKDAESTLNDLNDKIKGPAYSQKPSKQGQISRPSTIEIIEGLRKKQKEAQNKLNDLKSKKR